MAINPAMLAAFAKRESDDSEMPEYDEEMEGEELSEEPEAEATEEGVDEEALAQFLMVLSENAPQIESAAMAAEILDIADDLPEDVKSAIMTALEDMDPAVKLGLAEYVAEMDADTLHELVEQLEEEGIITNDGVVVPWLYWASRLIAG